MTHFKGLFILFLSKTKNQGNSVNYVNNEKVFFLFSGSVFIQEYEADKIRLPFTYFWPRLLFAKTESASVFAF